ncbi:MAG: hypothetical protein AAFQ43_10915 [Bacteroidota bacterium]
MSAPPASSRLVFGLLLVWVAVASGVGASGVLERASVWVFGAVVGGLTVLALGLAFGVPRLRAWALQAPMRPLILVHLARFVGLAFFGLYATQELPAAFAIPAGVGEVSVAFLAIPLAIWALPALTPKRWSAVLLWNVFGTAALLQAAGRSLRLTAISVELTVPLSTFPLVLISLVVVPLGLAAHAVLFARLWSMRREVEGLV